jgi:hypothetical protein
MAVIVSGKTFVNGEQLTAAKINNITALSTFDPTNSVDNASTDVVGGAIVVRDAGISTGKIADLAVSESKIAALAVTEAKIGGSAVTAAKIASGAVTTAKILDANVTFAKLTDVIDDDTMATATSTNIATSESIKAYVDSAPNFTPSTYAGGESVTLPNGLIMKWGKLNPSDGNNTVTYGTAFPTATVNVQYARFKALPYNVYEDNNAVTSESASGFDIYVTNASSYGTVAWQAIGY